MLLGHLGYPLVKKTAESEFVFGLSAAKMEKKSKDIMKLCLFCGRLCKSIHIYIYIVVINV